MSTQLPRLQPTIQTRQVERDGRLYVEMSMEGGKTKLFSPRVFRAIQLLAQHEDQSQWLVHVANEDPNVTAAQLGRLLQQLDRLGFLTQAANGVSQAPAPEPPEPSIVVAPDLSEAAEGFEQRDLTQITTTFLPQSDNPVARNDLVIDRGIARPRVVVTHPATGRQRVMNPNEYLLFTLLDGSRSTEQILADYQVATGQALAMPQLQVLVSSLARDGLMADTGSLPAGPAPRRKTRPQPRPPAPEPDDLELDVDVTDDIPVEAAESAVREVVHDLDLEPEADDDGDSGDDGELESFEDERTPGGDAYEQAAEELRADPEAKARRRKQRVKAVAKYVGVPVAILFVVGLIPYPFSITHPCTVTPVKRNVVRAPMQGVIGEILVDEGQQVEVGQVLGQLVNADLKLNVIKSETAVAKARADLELLQQGSRKEEVDREAARVAGLVRQLNVAKQRVDRVRRNVRQGIAPRADLESAKAQRAAIAGQLAEANANLRLTKAGSRAEELLRAEAEVRSLEAQLELDQARLEASQLKSDLDGVLITSRPQELLNTQVQPGQPVFEVIVPDPMRIEIFVDERDYDALDLKLPVTMRVASHPTTSFAGEVTHIAQRVETVDGRNIVRVEATTANPEGILRPNMTGFAEIENGHRPIGLLVLRRAIRWIRVRFLI